MGHRGPVYKVLGAMNPCDNLRSHRNPLSATPNRVGLHLDGCVEEASQTNEARGDDVRNPVGEIFRYVCGKIMLFNCLLLTTVLYVTSFRVSTQRKDLSDADSRSCLYSGSRYWKQRRIRRQIILF
jgi:hypothetical protein